jgi:hypothetical protein
VDGSLFDVDTRTEGRVQNLTVSGTDNKYSYDTPTETLTLTQLTGPAASFQFFTEGDIVDFSLNAGAITGKGRVKEAPTATSIVLDLSGSPYGFTLGDPGTVTDIVFVGTGSVDRSTTDSSMNHYTAQGVLQMGEALFSARQELDAKPFPVKAPSAGYADLEAID